MCAKARTIVGYYKRSSTARARLQEIQKQFSADPPLELVQDVPTRWNSEFAMLARLLKLKTAVTIDLTENDSVENLRNGEWRQVSAFVTVLQPVEEATTAACAESYPTLSLVVPLVHCLKLLLCDKTSDCDEYDFAQNLLKSIKARHPRMLESFCEMPVDKKHTTKFGMHGQCIWQSVLQPTMLLVALPSMIDATQSLQVLELTGDREFMEQ
ncbi:hypothetical protein HPB52_013055 [Rhipicephalus sanguineus]|uniref:Uncharacterized protein n=1 Tax=Rhipicephalus sanguineus TaxID=34632 RepID=A0A9D4QEM9_RHISA|nr:hypothetical protein HPB52_013055 [Rhipicephalus sanguineus]